MKLLAILSILGVLISGCKERSNSQTNQVMSQTELAADKSHLTILTWNTHRCKKMNSIKNELNQEQDNLINHDILVFQESCIFDMKSFGIVKDKLHKDKDYWLYIMTKHPILKSGTIIINAETGRKNIWADIQKDDTIVRVYNIHLTFKTNIFNISNSKAHRLKEIKTIIEHAEDFKGPVILAGDFNTSEFNRFEHNKLISKTLSKNIYIDADTAFEKKYTSMLQGSVDWIFVKDLVPVKFKYGNYRGSDHRWISAKVLMENKPKQNSNIRILDQLF